MTIRFIIRRWLGNQGKVQNRRKSNTLRCPGRLERLEPRLVLAPIANVGTNLGFGFDGYYAIYEGGYDIFTLTQSGLVLNGDGSSSSPGALDLDYVWDIDPNPNNCDPLAEDFSTCFTPDFSDAIFAEDETTTVSWAQLLGLGLNDDQFFDPFHKAIISLKVVETVIVAGVPVQVESPVDFGSLQIINASPVITNVALTPTTGPCGEPAAQLNVTFTDLNPTENLVAHVDWDWNFPGETPPPTPAPRNVPITTDGQGNYFISASHNYDSDGQKTVAIRLVEGPIDFDNDGIVDFYVEDTFGGGSVTVAGTPGGGALTVAINGAPSASVPARPIDLTSTVANVCGPSLTYAWSVTKDQTAYPLPPGTVTDAATFSFTPTATGTYDVQLQVTTASGTATDTETIVVTNTLLEGGNLFIGGSTGADSISLNPQDLAGATGTIFIYGGDGNDDIQIAGSITNSVWLFGGNGNDRLKGGSGHDVIVGGDGDDLLIGRDGRDILIGGQGADRIIGNADEDILVSGYVHFNNLLAALAAIQAEWLSARTYQQRTANIDGSANAADPAWLSRLNGAYFLISDGPGANVFDDGVKDVLTGDDGTDWFFANLTLDGSESAQKDKITDLTAGEFAVDIDFIQNGP